VTIEEKPKNRINPIKETKSTIHGYPSHLVVYKVTASRYYWVRYYYLGRYFIKSTKSETLKDAKAFAIKFYLDTMLTSVATKTNEQNKSFAAVAASFFKNTEQNTNTVAYKSNFSRYKLHLLPFFKSQNIDTITNSQLSQLVSRLQEAELQPSTIKHYLVVLRTIFKYAIANDLMKTLPLFPKVNGRLRTAQKRDYLTQDEYEKVVETTELLAKEGVTIRGVPITLEMKFLIQFMVNSFIRPSDLRVLRHQHIKKVSDGHSEWLTLNHPATKTNAHEIQAMPASVFIYERLVQFKKENHQSSTLDEFVFFPQYKNRTTALGMISRLFSHIVDRSGIKVQTGKNITLYSLRHTSIMLRIIIGKVDTLSLARNARTSQAMIDKFYAAHLTSAQVRKQLHYMPVSKTSKKANNFSTLQNTHNNEVGKTASKKTMKVKNQ